MDNMFKVDTNRRKRMVDTYDYNIESGGGSRQRAVVGTTENFCIIMTGNLILLITTVALMTRRNGGV